MAKIQYKSYFDNNGIRDFGDQVDIFLSKSEEIKDLEDNVFYDVSFVRVSKEEFERYNRNEILELAEVEDFGEKERLRQENLKLKSDINDVCDMVIDIAELIGG